MKKILIFIIGIFLISLASANGLNIENSTFNLNKTNGVDLKFNFTISNQEPFKFFNITSSNDILEFNKFDLESGENKTVEVTVKKDNNFQGDIKIIGEYFANLGASNETYKVKIDNSGVDVCNLDLIVGDKIVWNNTRLSQVKLKNLNTGEEIAIIPAESTHQEYFSNPQEFDYQVFSSGLPFSNVCHLNIRPTQGYIHSSEYDAKINLTLNILFEKTSLSATFLTTSYNLSYNEEKEDIFQVKNTGSHIAKGIHLSGDWFLFSQNDFDLNPGETKNIGITIKPIIFTTNQTDKIYNKSVKIEGNFEIIEQQINIYIKFHQFIEGNNGLPVDEDVLRNFVNLICLEFPDICPERIIEANSSNRNVTFTINEETYKDKILADENYQEQTKITFKTILEKIANLENSSKSNNNSILEDKVSSLDSKVDIWTKFNFLIYITFFLGMTLFIVYFILRKFKPDLKIFKMGGFEKSEKQW